MDHERSVIALLQIFNGLLILLARTRHGVLGRPILERLPEVYEFLCIGNVVLCIATQNCSQNVNQCSMFPSNVGVSNLGSFTVLVSDEVAGASSEVAGILCDFFLIMRHTSNTSFSRSTMTLLINVSNSAREQVVRI